MNASSQRWRNAAVAIVSHCEGGDQNAGTGLLVAQGAVLTAAHVVIHGDSMNKVRLSWKSEDPSFSKTSGDKNNGFHDAIEREEGDRGVFWSCPDLDLALIACNSPPDVPSIDLSNEALSGAIECWAEAFPRIAEDSLEQSIWMKGFVSDPDGAAKKSRCQFTASLHRKDSDDADNAEWGGASGTSLVTEKDGRVSVRGVIVQENVALKSQLTVVPMSEALRDREEGSLYAALQGISHANSNDWTEHDPDPSKAGEWIGRHSKRICCALEGISETAWDEIIALEPAFGIHPNSVEDLESAVERIRRLKSSTARAF